ncbi:MULTISPECIES: restriction endonuclease [unclassified Paenibacillus]|uniref:restriction endonuclease n=1 Tax=unclassified Paenibacillus TaxID=185978 RepID=UPI001B795F4D|nr:MULTISPECIES: restriction endonuclease [unclassified Paenibacillus]MBP1156743.1 restriction system protein [Paenibacillus sp. PvP091]MBP1172518.1 restriction system protein [Paenibacillus sp. PvR098]MBP2438899.1 restriction system protein [Paenibacillus sp. PvP052]
MVRTYYAEGRQIAYILKGLFIIGGLALYFNIPGLHWGFFFGILIGSIIVADIIGAIWTRKRRTEKKQKAKKVTHTNIRRTLIGCRSDEIILTSRLDDLSGAEFERLLALYFRDQGYTVKEVGVGGNDGGVDLVIVDGRGEKTAVQAKCYADHNSVPVQTIRELVAAKRNHDCILSLLVTTSDLTGPAKKEAEQFKVDYWHGALLEQKFRKWGKWKPGKKISRQAAKTEIMKASKEVAAASATICKCGAPMVRRKSRQGEEFLGCSKFPNCRHTKALQG